MLLLAHDVNDRGFMLWEALVSCGVLAAMTQALMSVSLATLKAEGVRFEQQAAQRWALSTADQLAAGASLAGRVALRDALLPSGVACLSEHPPWRLLSVRWQRDRQRPLPECYGDWPLAQQLCLDEEPCA
ncbi:hypothetical protein [Zymobacter sp. IVIA_12111.31 C1]|uniref:hypothetical protein n=1 Tax=Zymobacter sp. IVIA_12111.31 C1 TaxID=3394854 RepID=UPI0039C1C653